MEILGLISPLFVLLAVLGTVLGIIFGAIPGLTATMAVAVCLPLTFPLGLENSLALLLGLYVGGISGGLVPAVLLGIPGTPSSITTTLDGYPMAQRGHGEQAMRIGIVACGYADGYPRHCDTGTPVLVNGVRTRLVGRVSMDMVTIDLTPLRRAGLDAGFGSEVTLWGRAGNGAVLPIDEVAQAAGTVGYELMCALAPRVPVVVVAAG